MYEKKDAFFKGKEVINRNMWIVSNNVPVLNSADILTTEEDTQFQKHIFFLPSTFSCCFPPLCEHLYLKEIWFLHMLNCITCKLSFH